MKEGAVSSRLIEKLAPMRSKVKRNRGREGQLSHLVTNAHEHFAHIGDGCL